MRPAGLAARYSAASAAICPVSPSLSYTSTDVFLIPTAQLGAGGGLGRNQQNVANAINNFFNSGGTLPAGFVPLFGLGGANLGNALSQNSGEAATGAQQGAFQLMTSFLDVMMDPSLDGRGGFGAGGTATPFAPERAEMPQDIALAYAKAMKAPPYPAQNFEQRWNVWGSKPLAAATTPVAIPLSGAARCFRERCRGCGRGRLSPHPRGADRLCAGGRRHQLESRAKPRRRQERRVPGRPLWQDL